MPDVVMSQLKSDTKFFLISNCSPIGDDLKIVRYSSGRRILPFHIHFQYFHHLLWYSVYGLMAQIDRQFRFDSIANFFIASQRHLDSESSCFHGLLKNARYVIRRDCVLRRLSGNLVVSETVIIA